MRMPRGPRLFVSGGRREERLGGLESLIREIWVQQHLGEAAILVDVETTDDKMIEWNKEQSFDNN